MTPDSSRRAGLHSSIVLSAYIEPLIRGRRVAVLGDATLGLAEELTSRGARLVHAYDPEPARAAEALARVPAGRSPAVSYAVLAGDLGVRDGAFDVVVVPDLALFTDPAEILRRARKLVAQTGAAVFVSPNTRAETRRLLPESAAAAGRASGALGYYELYDLVSLQFAKVRMVGQAPFVGYTVADFAQSGELEVSVDTSLLASSEEPEHFIAVASDRPVVLEAYTVVELPWAEVAGAGWGAGAPAAKGPTTAELEEERLALTEARTRLSLVNAELEKLRDRQQADAREVEAKVAAAASLAARVVELDRELETREARVRELDARAGDNHVRAERLSQQIRDLEEELRRQRDRGTKLAKQLDDEKKARTKAELELGMVRGLTTSSVPPPPALPALPGVEPLAAPTPRSVAPPADLATELAGARARIDSLGRELEAARLRIGELEAEQAETLRRVPAPAPPDAQLTSRLAELAEAVNVSLREAADAAAGRDAAIARAQQLEAAIARGEEARLGAVSREQALEATLRREGARLADLERQLAEAHGRIAELEQQLARDHARAGGLEKELAGAQARAAELQRRTEEGRVRVAALEARVAEVERRPAELAVKLQDAEQRAAEAADAKAVADAAAAEIAALEAALRERGRVIAELGREMREGERIGKELIAELASAHGSNGAPAVGVPVVPGDADDLRAQLDRLAASAARAEADLQAAAWRVAQLERQLADAGAGPRNPTEVEAELEAALAAARDEVASLRRALATQGGAQAAG